MFTERERFFLTSMVAALDNEIDNGLAQDYFLDEEEEGVLFTQMDNAKTQEEAIEIYKNKMGSIIQEYRDFVINKLGIKLPYWEEN